MKTIACFLPDLSKNTKENFPYCKAQITFIVINIMSHKLSLQDILLHNNNLSLEIHLYKIRSYQAEGISLTLIGIISTTHNIS